MEWGLIFIKFTVITRMKLLLWLGDNKKSGKGLRIFFKEYSVSFKVIEKI